MHDTEKGSCLEVRQLPNNVSVYKYTKRFNLRDELEDFQQMPSHSLMPSSLVQRNWDL